MKRMIYVPADNEIIPDGSVYYTLPGSLKAVIDVICDEDFTTKGETLYDSKAGINLTEPFVHNFAGWEV